MEKGPGPGRSRHERTGAWGTAARFGHHGRRRRHCPVGRQRQEAGGGPQRSGPTAGRTSEASTDFSPSRPARAGVTRGVSGRRQENSEGPSAQGRRRPESFRSLGSSDDRTGRGGEWGGGSDRTSREPSGPRVLAQLPSTRCEISGEVCGARGSGAFRTRPASCWSCSRAS